MRSRWMRNAVTILTVIGHIAQEVFKILVADSTTGEWLFHET